MVGADGREPFEPRRDLADEVDAGGQLPTVAPYATDRECASVMRNRRTRHLAVQEDGEVVGVISMLDLVDLVVAEKQWSIDQLESFIRGGRAGQLSEPIRSAVPARAGARRRLREPLRVSLDRVRSASRIPVAARGAHASARRLHMRTIGRTLALGAAAVSLAVLAACGGGSSEDIAGKGRVAIVMSAAGGSVAAADAETPEHGDDCDVARVLQSADVTFSSMLARTLDGVLTDVTIDLPVTVDLLALGDGKDATLPLGFLPPGTYDQLVVVMTEVEVTLLNGTKIAVTPPGGGWTAIVRVAEPFTVAEGQTTTITLKFRRDLSFGCGFGAWSTTPGSTATSRHASLSGRAPPSAARRTGAPRSAAGRRRAGRSRRR